MVLKCSQARLYARLQNATIASNKQTIFALPTANGKTPGNYPATKGEFEHLTSTFAFLRNSVRKILTWPATHVRGTLRVLAQVIRSAGVGRYQCEASNVAGVHWVESASCEVKAQLVE